MTASSDNRRLSTVDCPSGILAGRQHASRGTRDPHDCSMTEPAPTNASSSFRSLLINLAAFCYAAGFFVSTKKFLDFAPTEPVAIGRVTVDGISKLQDYVRFGFFLLFVPLFTLLLIWLLPKIGRRITRTAPAAAPLRVVALTALPLLLSPILYLTTYKELWSVLFPPVLAWMILAGWSLYARFERLQNVIAATDRATHALIVSEGLALILFRYLATGQRIAHIPSLLLESIFVVVLLALWWGAVMGLSILFTRREHAANPLPERIAGGAFPLTLLPLAALLPIVPAASFAAAVALSIAGLAVFTLSRASAPSDLVIERLTAWFAVPAMLFVVGYAAAAHSTAWIDLFHHGETLGPASDYLRGKLPYSGVFPLHGLLQNGFLDAWLMEIFGRSIDVATMRTTILQALMIPLIWVVSWVSFRSWVASAGAVLGAFILAADNQRALLEIAVVILLVLAIRGGRMFPVLLAGAVSGVALFFSFEIGLYCLIAAPVSFVALWLMEPSRDRIGRVLSRTALFAAGVCLGAAPFLLWLGSKGLAGAFFTTSFVTIPGLIDATWSLPFPDIDNWFSKQMPAESLFQLAWHIRFVINPLILSFAVIVLGLRAIRRTVSIDDQVLAVLVVFATVTQRSALGRSDFFHQWFAAFLISPILVALIWRLVVLLRRHAPGVRIAATIATVVLIPVLLVISWAPSLLETRLESTVGFKERRAGTAPDDLGEESRRRIGKVVAAIEERVGRDEPIYDFSNQPALYFLADRPNPTRFYQVPIVSPIALQREVVRDLERSRPALIVMSSPDSYDRFDGVLNRDRAPLVASWIEHHYKPDVMVEGVDLWVPQKTKPGPWTPPDPVPGPDAVALRPQPAGRMAFPSVGSVTGGDGARWSSELFIRNPHDVPVAYRLRYVTAESIEEQPFAVPPHEARRIEDIARNLFGVTQELGTLWLVYDQTYPPVTMMVTTREPSSSRGSHSNALTLADAAGRERRADSLLIPGLDTGDSERMNLSLVNFGAGPATARIAVVDRNGSPLGTPYFVSLEEEKGFLVSDLATALGAAPAPDGGIRITVDGGVLAARLSIVDSATGSAGSITAVPVDE